LTWISPAVTIPAKAANSNAANAQPIRVTRDFKIGPFIFILSIKLTKEGGNPTGSTLVPLLFR
jgi:hypothetical protein